MKFKEYENFNGSWQEKTLAYLRLKGFDNPNIEWSVSEKVHGTNFSFWCDGENIKYAKRQSWITGDKSFYGHKNIVDEMNVKVWNMLHFCSVEQLVIYGELFGGNYPHKDVLPVHGATKIMKKLHYSPMNHFYAFDIMLDGVFVDVYEFEFLCKKFGILYAESLKRGTFDECLKYPNDFLTTIPGKFGLPVIKDNICEGVVLKTVKPLFYENDSGRVMLKNKNDKWKGTQKKVLPKQQIELSVEGQKILVDINNYITDNRLSSVLSKYGEFNKRDFSEVLQLFKDDVIKDFEYVNGEIDKNNKDWKILIRVIGNLCADIFRPIFLAKI